MVEVVQGYGLKNLQHRQVTHSDVLMYWPAPTQEARIVIVLLADEPRLSSKARQS